MDSLLDLVQEKGIVKMIQDDVKSMERGEQLNEWEALIEKYGGNWTRISLHEHLSEDFIREFQNSVKWKIISGSQKLSEDFIREFKDSINWDMISACQTLSEDFIREYQDKFAWCNISLYQTLSEDFIRELKDKVRWNCIIRGQKLSEDFIKEFVNELDLVYIERQYKGLTTEFISECYKSLDPLKFLNPLILSKLKKHM